METKEVYVQWYPSDKCVLSLSQGWKQSKVVDIGLVQPRGIIIIRGSYQSIFSESQFSPSSCFSLIVSSTSAQHIQIRYGDILGVL